MPGYVEQAEADSGEKRIGVLYLDSRESGVLKSPATRSSLEALAAEYASGEARLAPNPGQACEYCHLGALCRIAETDAERADEEGGDE